MGSSSAVVGQEAAAVFAGLLFGLGSVVSVGPNNLLLLREGLVRGRVGMVSGVMLGSWLSLLLVAAVAADGLSTVPSSFRIGLTCLGAVALACFALQALNASSTLAIGVGVFRPQEEPAIACLRRVAVVVWLNPLSYLEYLIVPAAICESYATASLRAAFICGLMAAAAANCALYVFGGGLIVRVFRTPQRLRLFDVISALILGGAAAALGGRLALGGF